MTSGAQERCPGDLTDQQWEIVPEMIPELRKSRKAGWHRSVDLREILNTIFCQCRNGRQWDIIRGHGLPKSDVYDDFAKLRDDGTLGRINDRLVGAIRVLVSPSGELEPIAASGESQSVMASESSGRRGYGGGRKSRAESEISQSTRALLLAVRETIASGDDAHSARPGMKQLSQPRQPQLQVIWADSKFHNPALNSWIGRKNILTASHEAVRRPPVVEGFVRLPKRWVVERTFCGVGRWRRPSRDDEHQAEPSEAMIRIASIGRMLRRLAPPGDQPAFKDGLSS